jgi:ubiquinone biosynthesis protein
VGARELTWRRTLLAIFVGVVFGQAVALLILVRDFAQPPDIEGGQVVALSLPFALIGTMGAIVVLELLFARPTRQGLHVPHPFKALRRRAGIMRRGWRVTRIIARNGLALLVGLRRGEVSTRSPEELARRVRVALEESGGVFIKLGQLLATRPDLLPPAAMAELGHLHASAAPLPEDQVAQVIREETGRGIEEVFMELLGSIRVGLDRPGTRSTAPRRNLCCREGEATRSERTGGTRSGHCPVAGQKRGATNDLGCP